MPESPAAPRTFRIGPHEIAAEPLDPALYVVATPIGNLGDITLRALSTLAAADLVACEDTRVTKILLDRYGIRTSPIPYHEHNAAAQRPKILEHLAHGRSVALVSDAGTPLVSDPGYKLVEAALAAGHAVVAVPGASAALAALVSAGLPTDAFFFAGFLPAKAEARRQRIEALSRLPATLILYESPHRVARTLADLAAILGEDRPAALCRELTKKFEEVRRGTLRTLAGDAAAREFKGEIVLVIGPASEAEPSDDEADALLRSALSRAGPSAAAAEVARLTGLDRKALFRRALSLKAAGGDPGEST